MKRLFSFVLVVGSAFASRAQEAPEPCAIGDARCADLSYKLDDLIAGLSMDCSGEACYGLWRTQMQDMQATSDAADALPVGLPVAEEVGAKAKTAAGKICGTQITGEASWVSSWVLKANRVLRRLERLQRGAGVVAPRTCTMTAG